MAQALDVDWIAIKHEYQAGQGKVTLRQLACKYAIKAGAVMARCHREGWSRNIEQVKQAVALAVNQVVEQKLQEVIDPAKEWINGTIADGKRIRLETHRTFNELQQTGVSPDDLDHLSKVVDRNDSMVRRSFGLDLKQDPSITVNNSISLANYQENLALIDRLSGSGKLNAKMIDMEALEEASLDLATKQGFMPVRSTDQAMQDLYAASALAKQQELDRVNEPAKPVDPEQAGSL